MIDSDAMQHSMMSDQIQALTGMNKVILTKHVGCVCVGNRVNAFLKILFLSYLNLVVTISASLYSLV